jgi:hypothetical protein
MIKIGLETLVMASKLRMGQDIGVNLNEIIRKMMKIPPRKALLG